MKIEQKVGWKGIFTLKQYRNCAFRHDTGEVILGKDGTPLGADLVGTEEKDINLITTEGKDYIADLAYNNNDTQEANWYLALFGNNLAPVVGDTAALVAARLGELNAEIVETNRPQWVKNTLTPNTGLSSSNSESPATFTAATDDTIYGAYMISNNVLAGTTGVLLAASSFSTTRSVLTDDILQLTYEIQLT